MTPRHFGFLLACLVPVGVMGLVGCERPAKQPNAAANNRKAAELGLPDDAHVKLKQWRQIDDFDQDLAQFETVFWESRDTQSLRRMIRETDLVKDKRVLEIGCGTGLLSLCCAQAGARHIVATDINPSAIANAAYNAEHLGLADKIDFRLVEATNSTAFAVIHRDERFDVILSNPPWEDAPTNSFASYAFYDPHFDLLRSLLTDFRLHLEPSGRLLLAYGCVDAIKKAQAIADEELLEFQIHDDRKIDQLPINFLPGMLLEITSP